MTGTLQIGATVNDGEQFAINKLAEWVTTSVRSSSDSKVAVKRCLKANIQHTLPQVWSTSLAQRELLQLSWTKGHLDAAQHCQRFGLENWWMWATNLEADVACSRKSAEVFSHQQAHQRCAHILASDTVPRFKEAKFEATPVAGRQAKPSGPNKRQRLLAATQGMNAHTGHNWGSYRSCQKSVHQVHSVFSVCSALRSWILSSATRVSTDRLTAWPQQLSTRRT